MADAAETSVVIPAFNEAASIGEVVRDLAATASWREILVVDDGSADDTGTAAAAGGAPRAAARVPPPAAERLFDADDHDAGVHEGGLQRAVRAGGCRAAIRRLENPLRSRRPPFLPHPPQGDHDLQPAPTVRAGQRC